MFLVKYLLRTISKIVGNLVKVFCYFFYIALPNKRFKIKKDYAPLFNNPRSSTIPRIFWQTNYTCHFTLPFLINHMVNRLLAYDYEFRFMTSEERLSFIVENFDSKVQSAYARLNIGAAQADFWRLLVVYKNGGVYLDIDGSLVNPMHWSIKDDDELLFVKTKGGELSNYFFAGTPGHPDIWRLIQRVISNIEESTSNNIYDLTGPGVFNEVLGSEGVPTAYYLTTVNQGNFTNEFFQYIDKPQGKWTKEQHKVSVLKPPQ